MIYEYKLITASTNKKLNEMVNVYVRKGWEPYSQHTHSLIYNEKEKKVDHFFSISLSRPEREPGDTGTTPGTTSVANAVWKGDKRLAQIISEKSDLARQHIRWEGSVPKLVNCYTFEQAFAKAKTDHLQRLREIELSDARRNDTYSRKNSNLVRWDKMAALWLPTAKKLYLNSVIVSDPWHQSYYNM